MAYKAATPRLVSVPLGESYKNWQGKCAQLDLELDIDGDTLPELIEKLSVLQNTHGKGLTLRIDIKRDIHYDGDFAINVIGYRDETPEEVQERLANEQQRRAHNVKLLDEQIEGLKQHRAKLASQ